MAERDKQTNDNRHPFFGHHCVPLRLTSSKSFITIRGLVRTTPSNFRLQQWNEAVREDDSEVQPAPIEQLPAGSELPRKEWLTLNRARAKLAKTRDNLNKWGFLPDARCPCGTEVQTTEPLLTDCLLSNSCSDADLRDASDTAQQWVSRWSGTL